MMFRLEAEIGEYSDLELALLVMLGQFGNGQERKNKLGVYYDSVQNVVEYLAVGICPKPDPRGLTDEQIRKALEKIRPTNEDFNAMVDEFIDALK